LYSILAKKVTAEEVNAAMKAASNESFGYNEDEIVSSDIIGINFGSLFDATQTKVMQVGDKQMVKTVSWYDNEMSYVSQLVRTVKHFAGLIS
jgi:glyceraldehyde 3-phosphate dehydrogenase